MITKIIKVMICVSDRSILGILNAITVLLYILEKLLSVGITFALHFQRVFSLHTHDFIKTVPRRLTTAIQD